MPRRSVRPGAGHAARTHADVARLDRRGFLRGLGGLGLTIGAGSLLAACSSDDATAAPVGPDGEPLPSVLAPEEQALVDQLNDALDLDTEIRREDVVYSVAFASFEVLTGTDVRVPFGLFDGTRRALEPAPTRAWLLSQQNGDVVAGPVEAPFYEENLGDRGVHVAVMDVADPGVLALLVEREGGWGLANLTARAAETSIVPVPGDVLEPLETPTQGDLLGIDTLCTNDPPCPMHEESFAAVRAAGRPAVVSVATPEFCSSAICAPTIDLLTAVREEMGTDAVDWIHAEVFSDAGNTVAPYVGAEGWNLPTEPWTFVVGPDGVIVDRFDGPLVASFLTDAIERATA